MIDLALKSIYFFLPAYLANSTCSLAAGLNIFGFLAKPLDFNREFKGKRILGNNKTFRGAILGVLVAIATCFLQSFFYRKGVFLDWTIIDFRQKSFLILGFLLGLGAIAGDAVKSFFKRRKNISPGQPFVPWDQVDFTLGGLVFVFWYQKLPISVIIFLLIFSPLLSFISNIFAFLLGIKKVWW